MRLDVSLPAAAPDFRLTPAQFKAAERQAVASTLRAGAAEARAEYRRRAPDIRKGAITRRVKTYKRKLWIGLEPINIARLESSKRLQPPRPGPGGFGIKGEPGVFLLPRQIKGAAFRRYVPYRRGQGRTAASIIEVTSPVPPRAGRRAAQHAYEFMLDYFPAEMGRQVDRRLEK